MREADERIGEGVPALRRAVKGSGEIRHPDGETKMGSQVDVFVVPRVAAYPVPVL
jgi:hypothetical protein